MVKCIIFNQKNAMEYDYSGPKGLISRNHWMKGNERVKEDEEVSM